MESDKTKWGPGPWADEPDRVEFRHAGFACLLRRGGGGAWCGYVALPAAHPWATREEYDVPAAVHGGITYGPTPCSEHVCHVPAPGESDDVRWIGFDCSHAGDLRPADNAYVAHLYNSMFGRGHDEYRDVAYVRAETERLAEQAAEVVS